jgi:phage shock protein E
MKFLFASLLLLSSACTKDPAPAAAAVVAQVDGAAAKKIVAEGGLLLDVRSPEEFADGHIEGARNVPVNEIEGMLGSLPKDKAIVVYCAVGRRAAKAAATLANAGFKVHNLGAMASWNK